jgi:hypothetical protein
VLPEIFHDELRYAGIHRLGGISVPIVFPLIERSPFWHLLLKVFQKAPKERVLYHSAIYDACFFVHGRIIRLYNSTPHSIDSFFRVHN